MNKEKELIRIELEKIDKYIKFLNILKDLEIEHLQPNLRAFIGGKLNRLSLDVAKKILQQSNKQINELHDLLNKEESIMTERQKSLLLKIELKNTYAKLLKEFREDILYYNNDHSNKNLDFNKEIWVLRSISYKVNFERKQKEDRYFLELIDYCLFESDSLEEMLDIEDDNPKDYFYHKMKIHQIIEELSNFENNETLLYFKKYAIPDVYKNKEEPTLLKVSDFNNENKIN